MHDSPARGESRPYRLFCSLGYSLSEEPVRRYFQDICTHGQVVDIYIPRHTSGRNKGYGFVTFENGADLLLAMQTNEHLIEGNVVRIRVVGIRPGKRCETGSKRLRKDSQGQGARSQGTTSRLFVGGIHNDVSEDDISSHFSRWGKIVDIYFPGKNGIGRIDYCFVAFDNSKSSIRAYQESDRRIAGQPIRSIGMADDRPCEGRSAKQGAQIQPEPHKEYSRQEWGKDRGALQQHVLPSHRMPGKQQFNLQQKRCSHTSAFTGLLHPAGTKPAYGVDAITFTLSQTSVTIEVKVPHLQTKTKAATLIAGTSQGAGESIPSQISLGWFKELPSHHLQQSRHLFHHSRLLRHP